MTVTAGEVAAGRKRPPSLAETAYDAIEAMIVSRRLAPGAMVSESDLVAELALGRTPIREALARLKAIGFVEVHPRRGVLVTNVDVIRHLELLEVRRPLDETVTRCAIRRGGEADIARLRICSAALSEVAEGRDREVYFRAKRDLHEAANRAAHNGTLAATMAALHAQSRRFWYSYEPTDRFAESARCHAEVIEGIATRDEARAVAGIERLFVFLDALTRQALDRRPLI
ncbi:GntR family transcriptional regulator [Methylobacterium sp. NEAU 140]|uniref:GntR family transcriptional regulator n=1 Tax=Methylobacterium sp. NEAU 140 TaxID=3064945 RepID=UPI002735D63C|nr:GntR family transcriptional regulator [Methylobacterium sp. NEAU 140]MDP4022551.1 GntR family transcriptional regulator [Methylobacterium sp. NEAU 140]